MFMYVYMYSNLCMVFIRMYVLHMYKSCVIQCNVPMENIHTYAFNDKQYHSCTYIWMYLLLTIH